jgi:hypothetical protein
MDPTLTKLAEELLKELTKLAKKGKSQAASEAAAGSKYEPTPSRGSQLKTDYGPASAVSGIGQIPNTAKFVDSVDRISAKLDKAPWYERISESAREIAGTFSIIKQVGMGEFIARKKLNTILEESIERASRYRGINEKLVENMVEYTADKNTEIKKLKETASGLEALNIALHEIAKDQEISSDGMKSIIQNAKNFDDGLGNTINLLEDLPSHVKKALYSIAEEGMSREKLDKAKNTEEYDELLETFNIQQDAINVLSDSLRENASAVLDVGTSLTNDIQGMLNDHRIQMGRAAKAGLVAAGYGTFQIIEDDLYRYQTSIMDSYRGTAVLMGMSHREVLEGILEFRDVLRVQAGIIGSAVYGEETHDVIKNARELGKTFGLSGQRGFQFGMQMLDSARIMGISAQLNSDNMKRFYADTAKTLNMSVEEFGDYFNNLAKDPSFAGFVNNLRGTSTSVQQSLQDEIKRRTRMNKLLGLSNEHLQKQINLETMKSWGSVVDAVRSQVGVDQLLRTYESEFGIMFTKAQRDILAQAAIDPNTLTDGQREVYNRLLTVMKLAPAAYEQQLARNVADAADANKQQVAFNNQLQKQITSVWGDMAGELFFSIDDSRVAMNNVANLMGAMGETVPGLMQAIMDGTHESGKLGEVFKTVTAASEAATGMDDPQLELIEGMMGADADFYRDALKRYIEIRDLIQGVVSSGPIKAAGGVGYALGQLAIEGTQFWMLKRALGLQTATVATATGNMATFSSGVRSSLGSLYTPISDLGKTTSGVSTKMGRLGGIVGSLSLVLLAAELGRQAGTAAYNVAKDESWFIDAVDFIASRGRKTIAKADLEEIGQFTEEGRAAEMQVYRNLLGKHLDKEIVRNLSDEQVIQGWNDAKKELIRANEERERANVIQSQEQEMLNETLRKVEENTRGTKETNEELVKSSRQQTENEEEKKNVLREQVSASKRELAGVKTRVDNIKPSSELIAAHFS